MQRCLSICGLSAATKPFIKPGPKSVLKLFIKKLSPSVLRERLLSVRQIYVYRDTTRYFKIEQCLSKFCVVEHDVHAAQLCYYCSLAGLLCFWGTILEKFIFTQTRNFGFRNWKCNRRLKNLFLNWRK
jgi:hypothetical protein